MNSNKLLPIIQDSIFQNSFDSDNVSIESINNYSQFQPGTLVFHSSMSAFTQIDMPDIYCIEVKCGTSTKPATTKRSKYVFKGKVNSNDNKLLYCPVCNSRLSHNGSQTSCLKHIPLGGNYSELLVTKSRYVCSDSQCKYFWDEPVPFKAEGHLHTTAVEAYAKDLLKFGHTLKDVSLITGLNKNVVKDIDKRRLEQLYTVDGKGEELVKPVETVKHLGIDEFLLHKGHKYATVIMDLDSGHVLYMAHGKKKQVVYDFIEWTGIDWMKNVEALACDMNSDYEEAFQERCP